MNDFKAMSSFKTIVPSKQKTIDSSMTISTTNKPINRTFSVFHRLATGTSIKNRESTLLANNILKIQKEKINSTFTKIGKANTMGKALVPPVKFKATIENEEVVRLKMYIDENFVKELDEREFDAECD